MKKCAAYTVNKLNYKKYCFGNFFNYLLQSKLHKGLYVMQEPDLEKLIAENKKLKQELEDQRILNDNTIEHSTALENELVEQNTKLNALQNKMKKYLSPQLYNQLLGAKGETTLVSSSQYGQ